FILIDLASGLIDMGGSAEEADAGVRLRWDEAHKGAAAALRAIRSSQVRQDGLRQVVRRLLARGEAGRALALANQVFTDEIEKAQALAQAALDLYRAGETEPAKSTYEKDVLPLFQDLKTKDGKRGGQVFPAAAALAEVLMLKPPKTDESPRSEAIL